VTYGRYALIPFGAILLVWGGMGLVARLIRDEITREAKDFAKTAVLVLFLLQPTLTQRTLEVFSCIQLGLDDW